MNKSSVVVINDFSGGEDTKTPIISMPLNKSPNMRNFHCAGIGNRLIKRGGFSKTNETAVESDDLDAFYPPGYQTHDFPLRTTAAYTQISQGFKCKTSSTVTKVRLWLKSVETPAGTDTVTLEIQSDSSGVPSGAEVTNGIATAIDISDTLTSSYAWVTFTFSTAPTLVAGTQYHLVLQGAFTISAVNYVVWGADDYDVIYPDGTMSVYDATTWTASSLYDACFEVYIAGGAQGNDGFAMWDFSSKNMLLGVFGTSLYKMNKDSSGNPDGTWDALEGGAYWDTYTKFMCHFDGSDAATAATDEIGKTITFAGDAQLDTAQKKFGTASLLCDGTGDYISMADDVHWTMGSGNFTIDFCVRFAALTAGTYPGIFSYTVTNDQEYYGLSYQVNEKRWEFKSEVASAPIVNFNGSDTLVVDTWYHVAVVRNGDDWYIYRDGVQKGTVNDTSSLDHTGGLFYIGDYGYSSDVEGNFNGWIDEFRVSKGMARWTAAFTPETSAYSATASSITSSRFWTMADWQSGRALINTDIGLYYYIGSGDVTSVAAAPVGKFIVIWKNYVFMAGIRGSPNTVRYSDLSDYTTWTATNTLNFDTSDGDVITGIRILKGKLYIFKRYSIFRITYLGSSPTFQVDQISGIGSPCHYTIKGVDIGGEVGNVLIYLTTDKKLAIFDGYNVQTISDVLTEETNDLFATADDQPLSFNDMNFRYTDLFHASVKTDSQEYILYSVLGTDTSVNYAFVFDYKTGGIFPYDGQVFASSCYALSTSKVKKLYCSGYTGYAWLQESGDDDDGSDINAYWVSGKIKSSAVALLNKNLLLGVNAKYATSTSTISVTLQYRFNWGVSWITPTPSTFNFNHNDELNFGRTALFDIGSINNMLQIKIKDSSSNPAPTIYGLELYGETKPLGSSMSDKATA